MGRMPNSEGSSGRAKCDTRDAAACAGALSTGMILKWPRGSSRKRLGGCTQHVPREPGLP
jgi:hypothetical protein